MLHPILLAALVVFAPGDKEEGAWKVYSPEKSGISISFPGTPRVKSEKIATGPGTAQRSQHIVDIDDAVFNLILGEFDERVKLDNPEAFFNGGRDSLLRETGGKLVAEKKIKLGNIPGCELEVDIGGKAVLRDRTYLSGSRTFQVITVYPVKDEKAAKDAARFMDSLKLVEPK